MAPMIKAGISNTPPISNHIDQKAPPFSTITATKKKTGGLGIEGGIEKISANSESAVKKKMSNSSDVKKKEKKASKSSSIPAVVSTEEMNGVEDATENNRVPSEVMRTNEGSGSDTYGEEDENERDHETGQRQKPAKRSGKGNERGRHKDNSHKRKNDKNNTTSSLAETANTDMSRVIRSTNVCNVIKGEIHNVLNIMRSDPKCASPMRFHEEMPTDEQHPLLLRFRELHRTMTEWEFRHGYDGLSRHDMHQPEARIYLPPFCVAIQSRDISAKVTGAALQSLQKFLLYGFLSAEGPNAFSTIANTLLLCTFEESSSLASMQQNEAKLIGGRGDTTTNGRLPAGRTGNGANEDPYAGRADDEQVVLRLLEMSALIVRSASAELKPDVVVGLLDICLHVSHRAKRASGLLKSAASDSMKQIVLEVFSRPNLARKREEILAKLANLLNPKQNSDAYVVNSLTLVNFALETLTPERLTRVEIGILKKDLCTHLLSWSSSHDLVILSLTMRIIFNLFQTIRNHLKVPLEVFLTSVHLRILEHSGNSEEREVALESLLEFCREPALIKDLYLNYDCDVQCTNLYANICTTLADVTAPLAYGTRERSMNGVKQRMNGGSNAIAHKAAAAASEVPMNILNVLALESLLTIIESIARRCKNQNQQNADTGAQNTNTIKNPAASSNKSPRLPYSSSGSMDLDDDLELSEEDLQERKRRKAALSRVASLFNRDPDSKDWIKLGIESNVLEETPESVALALYTAPGLDKDQLGTYLGKGPVDKYPFHHKVRLAFVTNFDFSDCGRFASALRTYLHKFRLPGEAQQIDRLMDAFSKEYFKQQGKRSVFKNSDAVFVLAFSTIMLNTDLHNPNIKNKKKMTRQQFIRNNRGINKGEDLPEAMLAWLYTDIREHELQVQREIGEFISHSDALDAEHFRGAWGDMLRKNVAVAVFTTADEARKSMFEAGVHEKDMFVAICKPTLRAISSAFVRSWDDSNIVSTLKGLEQMAKIATFFGLDDTLNEILSFLLSQGRDYIIGCVALEYSGIESGAPINQEIDDDTLASMSIVDPDSPVPHALLRVREIADVDTKKTDINGAAAYRGLLALNMGLRIVRTLFPRIRGAWPELISVFGCLRDARALPTGLSDLDDFADSDGNVLPLSLFARNSQRRLDEIYSLKAGKRGDTKQGWFRGVFSRAKGNEDGLPGTSRMGSSDQWRASKISKNARILLQISEWTEVEKFMILGPHLRLQLVQQSLKSLLDSIDLVPMKPSPTYEQHQAFALELATRALLKSDDRAQVLFPMFLSKFNSVVEKCSKLKRPIPVPFLMERVIVTILRSNIHLYHIPKMRQQLQTSLALISAFPKPFLGHIADRTACGVAIIWRSSFPLFNTSKDLKLICDMFDTLAHFQLGRGLIFDGIASTIECTLPSSSISNILEYEEKVLEQPTLTIPTCAALQRILFMFIYGSYERDYSLAIPAMKCVEKLYKHVVQLMLIEQKNDPILGKHYALSSVPEIDLWNGISVAFFTVCANPDEKISKKGLEACQRHIFVPDMTEVPDNKWMALINIMISKQPPKKFVMSRINSLSIIAQLMVKLFPTMSVKEDNRKGLTEITKKVAAITNENLENRCSPDVLFDLSVTVITHLSVQLGSSKSGGDRRYCKWASDTFAKILENNGATKAKKMLKSDGNEGDDKDDEVDEKGDDGDEKDGEDSGDII